MPLRALRLPIDQGLMSLLAVLQVGKSVWKKFPGCWEGRGKALPLPCVASVARTLPLPCVPTAFVATVAPSRAWLRHCIPVRTSGTVMAHGAGRYKVTFEDPGDTSEHTYDESQTHR